MVKVNSGPEFIRATYRLACGPGDADALARRIAYEQTVEVPEQLVTPDIADRVVGRVITTRHLGNHAEAVIDYHAELCNGQLSQLLILVFGNVSMFPGVRLVDLVLPDSVLSALGGPGHGSEGLRRLLGVYDRPLLATAVKPRGTSIEGMAAIAGAFAEAGGDIIKDDQNLADDAQTFGARISACQAAVQAANAHTGRNCLYFPHLSAPDEELESRLKRITSLGIRGVLACPLILGLERIRALARDYGLIVMAHPALTGSYTNSIDQGISHGVLLGTLFRLAGVDISVYANYGGRFALTKVDCLAIRDRLRAPLGTVRPAFPAPAGGMQYANLPELCTTYGPEAVFLIGGSLLGHTADLAAGTRAFLDQIRVHFHERLVAPEPAFVSACEVPAGSAAAIEAILHFRAGYRWDGRSDVVYKPDQTLPFTGVRRVELLGQHGERTAFDLRYFEIAPGGYTSLEKHCHTHVVIAVRGEGVIMAGGHADSLRAMDIAYVAPFEVHQVRNTGTEPFGFFCIVDHDRDRPMAP